MFADVMFDKHTVHKETHRCLLSWDDIIEGMCPWFIQDFREKNTDHMRPDIVALLKSSKNAFICGLMGIDPVATFRWAVLRAYFRAMVAFREAGRRHTHKKTGKDRSLSQTGAAAWKMKTQKILN